MPPVLPDPSDPRVVFAPLSARLRALGLDAVALVACFVAIDAGLALPVLEAVRPWHFLLLTFAWFAVFPATALRATPGQRAAGLRVLGSDGRPLPAWRAGTRAAALLTLGAGVAALVDWHQGLLPRVAAATALALVCLAALTPRRQAGHDLALRTLVVRAAAARAGDLPARLGDPAFAAVRGGFAGARTLLVDALHVAPPVAVLALGGAHVHDDDLRGRVTYALGEARALQDAIGAYHAAHGRLPAPGELGAAATHDYPAGGGYRAGADGVIRIAFSVRPELRDGELTLTPAPRGGGGLDWTCVARGDLARYAPIACRDGARR